MHLVGGVLGLLVPAICVAALSLPHLFEAGKPVSAKQMNENFAAIGEAVASVAAKKPGLPKQLPQSLAYALNMMIFKASETGIFYSRTGGPDHGDLTVVLRVGDGQDGSDQKLLTCGGEACGTPVRSYYANSTSILVPAGAFIQVEATYPAQTTAAVSLFWQPSDSSAAAVPTQVYPPP